MKFLTFVVAFAASFFTGAAFADPVVWTLNNVTTHNGQTVTGSFTYDADTNTYSAINIASTGGAGPFTAIYPGGGFNSASGLFIQSPPAVGQNGVLLRSANKTNAGGTLTLDTASTQGGLFTCNNANCTVATLTPDRNIATGTIVGVAVATVPTLSEWAVILIAFILAGGAALMLQRRRMAV